MTALRCHAFLAALLLAAPLLAAEPVLQIEILQSAVYSLQADHVLPYGTVRSLTVKLEHTSDALRQADAQRAITQLQAFENEAQGLTFAGRLPSKIGQALVDGAASTRLMIERLAFTVPTIITEGLQPCTAPESCVKTPLWVHPKAPKGGNGTRAFPVATIAEAIALARKWGACGLEIHLAPGLYVENVDVTLHLDILGDGEGVVLQGSVVNRGGWDLRVDRITIRSSPWPGGVVVESQCEARTEISRTTIEGATGSGVTQRGGTLRLGLSAIRGTVAVPGEPESGTGLRVTGGAKAVLGLVGIEENGGGGLLASGEETGVYAAGILVARNRVTPYVEPLSKDEIPQAPGIDIRNGALLLMQFSVLRDNDLYGLTLRDGARAHVRFTTVDRTRSLSERHPYAELADSNVAVINSGIELFSYTLSRSVVGLLMADSLGAGSQGVISHNNIGLAISWSGTPVDEISSLVRCLTDKTIFPHNDRNIDSLSLPLPPPDIPGEDSPPPPPCARVPFDCTWCGV
jgi:hypothetical protein